MEMFLSKQNFLSLFLSLSLCALKIVYGVYKMFPLVLTEVNDRETKERERERERLHSFANTSDVRQNGMLLLHAQREMKV
mmetsp:Transcript_58160/g.66383  ORF Transcript_58160/g.66383 Transcript_58160/m.66383 type:complete len:80 (+) Transcript_58160:144-383(+)